MISARAKTHFNDLVMMGMRNAFVGPEDIVNSLGTVPAMPPWQTNEVVMLSVASYRFRLMILVYFTRDTATQAHFAHLTRVRPEDLGPQAFTDAICECANMCCGTFNRELGRVYPHIGMSTPNILDRHCADHLQLMAYGHLQHFALHLQSGMTFPATLCVCEYADLDFALAPPAQAESTGELEFF